MDMFTILAIALAAMMIFSIVAQRKRVKQVEGMRSAIEVGDIVITIGGFSGTIAEIGEDDFVIESEGTRLRIKKWGISSSMKRGTANSVSEEV